MLGKALLGEIILGLPVVRGWKGSVEENINTCKRGIRLDMTQTRDLHKRSELFLTSLIAFVSVNEKES